MLMPSTHLGCGTRYATGHMKADGSCGEIPTQPGVTIAEPRTRYDNVHRGGLEECFSHCSCVLATSAVVLGT